MGRMRKMRTSELKFKGKRSMIWPTTKRHQENREELCETEMESLWEHIRLETFHP
jgi:hypothetical protein